MLQEKKAIAFLQSIDHENMSIQSAELALTEGKLFAENGKPYTQAQVSSLLHTVRQAKRKAERVYRDKCGIDRDSNPCGDASDY